MLQNIGDLLKGKKFLAWLILIPLVVVFAIWGATGAINFDLSGSRTVAASGAGIEVNFDRTNRIWQDELSLYQQQTGSEAPQEIRDLLLEQTLETLIVGELIAARAGGMGYAVSERAVFEAIQSEPAFLVEGRYSEGLALARLSQLGISADQYRRDIRRDLQNLELQRSLFLGEFVTPGEIGRVLTLEGEQRAVASLTLSAESFKRQVRLTEEDLRTWYESNKEQYRIPEKVSLRYLVLSFEDIKNNTVVSDAELKERYLSQRDQFVESERRKSRHILTETEAEANDVLAKLKAGADFAELAKTRSKDTGSASSGGDLGWADRSVFVTAFADALFSMKKDELSGPVKTEFGYHVIQLQDVQPEVVKPLADVQGVLEEDLRGEKASKVFADREDQLQLILQRDPGVSLATLAAQLQLPVLEMPSYVRGQPSPLGPSADFESVVFSDTVFNARRVSRPIVIGEDRLMIVQVVDSQPAAFASFESVRDRVLQVATESRAVELLNKVVEDQVTKINSLEDLVKVSKDLKTGLQSARFIDRNDPSIPTKLRDSVFASKRPQPGLPVVGVVKFDGGDAAIFVITESRNAAEVVDPATRTARIRQVITLSGRATLASYVSDLRANAKVEKNTAGFQ